MKRVRSTHNWNFSGEFVNPGAMTCTRRGAATTPTTAVTARITDSMRMADRASLKASSRPWRVRYSEKTGMKATVSEPSAKSLRNRFGILKATKKASEARPAPKKAAMTTSLAKPNILLRNVAPPTTPAARVTRVFSVMPDTLMGNAGRQRCASPRHTGVLHTV